MPRKSAKKLDPAELFRNLLKSETYNKNYEFTEDEQPPEEIF
jgi:hypothetical protein